MFLGPTIERIQQASPKNKKFDKFNNSIEKLEVQLMMQNENEYESEL